MNAGRIAAEITLLTEYYQAGYTLRRITVPTIKSHLQTNMFDISIILVCSPIK